MATKVAFLDIDVFLDLVAKVKNVLVRNDSSLLGREREKWNDVGESTRQILSLSALNARQLEDLTLNLFLRIGMTVLWTSSYGAARRCSSLLPLRCRS